METDLRELFEAEFGSEPHLPSAEDRLRAGRRAWRRRQLAAVSVLAGAVALIGSGAALIGEEPPSRPTPSHQPTPSGGTTGSPDEAILTRSVPVDTSWTEDCGRGGQPPCPAYLNGAAPVGMRADGTVVRTGTDVVIIKRSKSVVSDADTRAIALELRTPLSLRPCWYLLTRDTAGEVTASIADPSMSQISFRTWAEAVLGGRQVAGAPGLTRERVIIGG